MLYGTERCCLWRTEGFLKRETESPDLCMDMDGEPSASEPTFTPPGSLPRVEQVEELPTEEAQLLDLDYDVLEGQQFSAPEPPQQREHRADQQDTPQGELVDTNLLGVDEEEGVAPGSCRARSAQLQHLSR